MRVHGCSCCSPTAAVNFPSGCLCPAAQQCSFPQPTSHFCFWPTPLSLPLSEVASLQEELQALRSSSTAGLERCGERIDAVEESAAAALVAAAAASEAAAAAAHGQVPGTPVAEIKVRPAAAELDCV